MGRPNVPLLNQPTLFDGLEIILPIWVILLVGLGATKLAIDFFLTSDLGLAMRATGMNPIMASAQGIYTDRLILLGMAMSNALAALSGALFAQVNGFADVALGVGTVVVGLATVILGEAIFPSRTVRWATLAVVLGCLNLSFGDCYGPKCGFSGFACPGFKLGDSHYCGAGVGVAKGESVGEI